MFIDQPEEQKAKKKKQKTQGKVKTNWRKIL